MIDPAVIPAGSKASTSCYDRITADKSTADKEED
ncbi:MAG: hypothetical protein H6Q64_1245 [Firmicutes bacterium]|nr:hypothetical protein [Bacillota bacterium]